MENEIIEEIETNDIDNDSTLTDDSSLVHTEEVLQDESLDSYDTESLLHSIVEMLSEDEQIEAGEGTTVTLIEDDENLEPNYSQYIYDFLTDSTITVHVDNDNTFLHKSINDYTVTEGLLLVIALILFIKFFTEFVKNNVFRLK